MPIWWGECYNILHNVNVVHCVACSRLAAPSLVTSLARSNWSSLSSSSSSCCQVCNQASAQCETDLWPLCSADHGPDELRSLHDEETAHAGVLQPAQAAVQTGALSSILVPCPGSCLSYYFPSSQPANPWRRQDSPLCCKVESANYI